MIWDHNIFILSSYHNYQFNYHLYIMAAITSAPTSTFDDQDIEGDKSIFNTINRLVMTPRVMFDLHSMNFLALNKKDFPTIETDIDICVSKFRKSFLICLALSGAFALSLRRYLPTLYGTLSFAPFVVDLGLVTMGVIMGSRYGSNVV
jgi:hypothetical protein